VVPRSFKAPTRREHGGHKTTHARSSLASLRFPYTEYKNVIMRFRDN